MKTLILVLPFFVLVGCGSKSNNKKSRIPNPETVETLMNVKQGAGESCINFDSKYGMKIDDKIKEVSLFALSYDEASGTQVYRFNREDAPQKIELKDFIDDLKLSDFTDGDLVVAVKALIFEKMRVYFNSVVDYLVGGIVADGSVQDKTFKLTIPGLSFFTSPEPVEIPMQYSVDCFYEDSKQVTSFHVRFDDWAMRMVYYKNIDGTIEVSSREINDTGTGPDVLVSKGTLLTAEMLKEQEEKQKRAAEQKKQEELAALPEAYRWFVENPERGISFNLVDYPIEAHNGFAAFYNEVTQKYKVIDGWNNQDGTWEVPFALLSRNTDLIKAGWSLAISTVQMKEKRTFFFWKESYYFPLDDSEKNNLTTVASNEILKSCVIEKKCDDFKSKFYKEHEVSLKLPKENETVQIVIKTTETSSN